MKDILDSVSMMILIGLGAFVGGMVLGFQVAKSSVAQDCKNFGAFTAYEAVYSCKVAAKPS